MTDQDNLRERVAAAIYKNQDVVVGDAGEIFGDAAQAVIDSLHLESYDVATGDGCPTTHVHGWMEDQ